MWPDVPMEVLLVLSPQAQASKTLPARYMSKILYVFDKIKYKKKGAAVPFKRAVSAMCDPRDNPVHIVNFFLFFGLRSFRRFCRPALIAATNGFLWGADKSLSALRPSIAINPSRLSHDTRHTSHTNTRHTSHVTRHTSPHHFFCARSVKAMSKPDWNLKFIGLRFWGLSQSTNLS